MARRKQHAAFRRRLVDALKSLCLVAVVAMGFWALERELHWTQHWIGTAEHSRHTFRGDAENESQEIEIVVGDRSVAIRAEVVAPAIVETSSGPSTSVVTAEALPDGRHIRPPARKKIAFATFISKDPKSGKLPRLDGAGVLAESIQEHMGHLNIDVVTIVPPSVNVSRPILKKFGYKVLEFPAPDLNKIRVRPENRFFREKVGVGGCCGHLEMLKIEAYRMIDYDYVVVMDTDTLVHASFEELFSRKETTLYTAPYAASQNEQLQGSFIVIRPNVKRYHEIMNTWYAGSWSTDGWNHSGIGHNYGGSTVQGILPYFCKKVHPEDSAEVDHCTYNHNGDKKTYCKGFDHKMAKVNHFTVCQKPWYCLHPKAGSESCTYFTYAWWRIYNRLAKKLGRGNLDAKPCIHYRDGLSSAYPPLLPEVGPATDGW